MRIVLTVVVLLVCFLGRHAVAQEGELLSAVKANLDCWVSGDVLVEVNEEFDGLKEGEDSPGGAIIEIDKYVRTVFDYEKRRFAQLHIDKVGVTNFDAMVFEPVEKVTWRGASVDFSTGKGFSNGTMDNHPTSYSKERLDALLQNISVRDYRTLCLMGGTGTGDNIRRLGDLLISLQPKLSKTVENQNSNEIELWFTKSLDLTSKDEVTGKQSRITAEHQVITIDTIKLVPTRRRLLYSRLLDTDLESYSEECNWLEIDGVYVPKEYNSSGMTVKHIGGERVYGRVTRSLNFHWFSLNDEINADWFDGSKYTSKQKVINEVLPERAGASTLMESNQETDDPDDTKGRD